MSTQASFTLRGRNPDVLTCIANLSNDEVFTPPDFANRMLDTLAEAWAANHPGSGPGQAGANIWADPTVTFLDPCTKSGVFLREITSRLTEGLKDQIPDLRTRVDHILTKQVFGIGITHLTSLLARRSVYCSKHAKGEHSIGSGFATDAGNIWFERMEHTWVGDNCKYCGTGKKTLDRSEELESHAYALIHTDNVKARINEIFGKNMQFDVIIGNPPYQLKDGGASASARPIYHQFIEKAIDLDPRYVVMVTPSRWFTGGKGLDDFRSNMLTDRRLRRIVDFIVDRDAFPSVNINGGVNYFVWDRDNESECEIVTVAAGGVWGKPEKRPLDEFDIFIRRNDAVGVLRKVMQKEERRFATHVSSRKPFGLPTDYHGASNPSKTKPIKFYGSGRVTWVSNDELLTNHGWVNKWKVLIGRATDGNENYPLPIWDQVGPFIARPGEACSETFLVAHVSKSQAEAKNVVAYMSTKFFRFLVSLRKSTQDNKADLFAFVPDLDMTKAWTDKELYKRYGITEKEQALIDELIRTMEFRSAIDA